MTFQSEKSEIICYCVCAKNKEKKLFDKSYWFSENLTGREGLKTW